MGKVLITGATGHTGRLTVQFLSRRQVLARAVSRQPNRIPELPAVERARFDYLEPSTFETALEDVDALLLTVPPGSSSPLGMMGAFLEVAATKVKKIVAVTMIGVENEPRSALGQLEQAIVGSGATYVLLRPNILMDNFHGLWRESIVRDGVIALPAGEAETTFVDAYDVDECIVTALTTNTLDNKAFTLTGSQATTYAQAAAILSHAIGKPIRYESIDDAAFREKLAKAGVAPNTVKSLSALFTACRAGLCATQTDSTRAILRRPPRTLAEYATMNAGAWKRG